MLWPAIDSTISTLAELMSDSLASVMVDQECVCSISLCSAGSKLNDTDHMYGRRGKTFIGPGERQMISLDIDGGQ